MIRLGDKISVRIRLGDRASVRIRLGDRVLNKFFINQHHPLEVYHFLLILF